MSRTPVLLAFALILGAAYAHAEPAKSLMPSAKVSLVDAIKSAQQQSQGNPIQAEYEQQKDGKWVYDIKVANGAALTQVKVDANDGAVLSTQPAKQHDEEGGDDRDDDKD